LYNAVWYLDTCNAEQLATLFFRLKN
jgi:hypothetical protein